MFPLGSDSPMTVLTCLSKPWPQILWSSFSWSQKARKESSSCLMPSLFNSGIQGDTVTFSTSLKTMSLGWCFLVKFLLKCEEMVNVYPVCYFRDMPIKAGEGLSFQGHLLGRSKGPQACGFPYCQRIHFASKFFFKPQWIKGFKYKVWSERLQILKGGLSCLDIPQGLL